MKRLIIFDCDGVLVDSEPLAAKAFVAVYHKHGLSIDASAVAACVGMKQADIIEKIGVMTGHRLGPEGEADIWPVTQALFAESLVPVAGVKVFLDAHEGARCVASSSSLERIGLSLSVTGLDRYFGQNIFSSSMVARGKPAPDLFLHAAKVVGYDPADCVVIEDSPFGIQGARAAGMTAIGLTAGSHTYPTHSEVLREAGAHQVCDSWEQVESVLRERGFLPQAEKAG